MFLFPGIWVINNVLRYNCMFCIWLYIKLIFLMNWMYSSVRWPVVFQIVLPTNLLRQAAYTKHIQCSNLLFWFVGWRPHSGRGFKDQEILSSCVIQPSDQRVWSTHGGRLHSLLTSRVSTDGKGGKQTRYCFQGVHMEVNLF